MDPDPLGYGDLADPDPTPGVYGMGASPGGWAFGSPNAWSPFAGEVGGYGSNGSASSIDPAASLPSAGLFGQLSDILPRGANQTWGLLAAPAGTPNGSTTPAPNYGGLFSSWPGADRQPAQDAAFSAGSAPSSNPLSDEDATSGVSALSDASDSDASHSEPDDLDTAQEPVSPPETADDPLADVQLAPASQLPAQVITGARQSVRLTRHQPRAPRPASQAGAVGPAPSAQRHSPIQASPARPNPHPTFLQRAAAIPLDVLADGQRAANSIDALKSEARRWLGPPLEFVGRVATDPDTYLGLGEVVGGYGLGALGVGGLGAAGIGEGASLGAATPIAVPLAVGSAGAITAGAGLAADGGNRLGAVVSKAVRQTGSYTNYHASGKVYVGKGSERRARRSARRVHWLNNDPLVRTDWTPASNDREAFKDEARRLEKFGGPKSAINYNKIHSPGKKYLEEDGPGP